MTAEAILADLLERGIESTLTPDGAGIEVPAGVLTDAQRAAIRAHKPELIAAIQESARVTAQLLDAAMLACDHWNDSPAAREQMRQDCLRVPLRQRADLLAHFRENYPKKGAAS